MNEHEHGGDPEDDVHPSEGSVQESGRGGRAVPRTQQLCRALVRSLALDGAAVAMIGDTAERDLVHATDPVIAHLDELQFTLAEGPCLDAYTSRAPVLVGNLDGQAAMDRWPVFAQEAARAGARAAFAFPMIAESVCFGVLELYRRTPGDLDGHDAIDQVAEAVSALSRVALSELVETTPEGAFQSWPPVMASGHAEVHQAAGFVAVHLDIPVDDAMARLRAAAYSDRTTLVELAHRVLIGETRLEKDT